MIPADHPQIPERKTGLLLVNLGTPASLELSDIRRYLAEFLSDRRVIDYPAWFWQPILRGIILNVRPKKTRAAYEAIWHEETNESPLRYYTRQQAELLAERLQDLAGLEVDWAMNYGEPAISERLNALLDKGCRQLLVLPLYPQYSATTTASVFDRLAKAMASLAWQPAIRTLDTWHDDPAYIDNTVDHLQQALASLSFKPDTLLLSFHGLPERYLQQGDPYHCFCQKSGRLIGEGLKARGFNQLDVKVTFQSRFGPEKWLEPYTDVTLEQLPAEGKKSVAVFSPGFVADCVETLEELGIQGHESFAAAGGENYATLPCLNDSKPAIDMLETLVRRELKGWSSAKD